MPPLEGPQEDKSPTRDESRGTTEPISVDVFSKVFKNSMEKLEKRFEEQDHRFENLEQPFQRWDVTSVEMKRRPPK